MKKKIVSCCLAMLCAFPLFTACNVDDVEKNDSSSSLILEPFEGAELTSSFDELSESEYGKYSVPSDVKGAYLFTAKISDDCPSSIKLTFDVSYKDATSWFAKNNEDISKFVELLPVANNSRQVVVACKNGFGEVIELNVYVDGIKVQSVDLNYKERMDTVSFHLNGAGGGMLKINTGDVVDVYPSYNKQHAPYECFYLEGFSHGSNFTEGVELPEIVEYKIYATYNEDFKNDVESSIFNFSQETDRHLLFDKSEKNPEGCWFTAWTGIRLDLFSYAESISGDWWNLFFNSTSYNSYEYDLNDVRAYVQILYDWSLKEERPAIYELEILDSNGDVHYQKFTIAIESQDLQSILDEIDAKLSESVA